jgi:hypothetical protein
MVGTLFSIILAVLLWEDPHTQGMPIGMMTRVVMLTVSFSLLLLLCLAYLFSLRPLQKAEQNATPRILEMFHKDKYVHVAAGWLIIFALATLILTSEVIYPSISQKQWFFPAWIVLLGITIDLVFIFIRRILIYINPFGVIHMFTKQAGKSIDNNRELDLCDDIDALSEVAIKGIQKNGTSICHEALNQKQQIIRKFLLASKSIAHRSQDSDSRFLGITDKVSYTLFYLYQRLDIIFDKALKNNLEPTCSLIITLLGKIAVDTAKYDLSLTSAPLRFIGKCAKRAQDHGFEETVMTASCLFLEVAKEITSSVDLTYYEIKDPFLSIINGMEVLTKESFKKDKTININLLMEPFKELRALFENDAIKNHQDKSVIVQNIDRVLGEYEALLIVMNTMPAIPKVEDEIAPAPPNP